VRAANAVGGACWRYDRRGKAVGERVTSDE
jgi:hypothetical protein